MNRLHTSSFIPPRFLWSALEEAGLLPAQGRQWSGLFIALIVALLRADISIADARRQEELT